LELEWDGDLDKACRGAVDEPPVSRVASLLLWRVLEVILYDRLARGGTDREAATVPQSRPAVAVLQVDPGSGPGLMTVEVGATLGKQRCDLDSPEVLAKTHFTHRNRDAI